MPETPTRLTESQLTELLDDRGLLRDARGPGCYALEVATPDAVETTLRQWFSHHDHAPPDDALDRIADAGQVAYVGASGNIYERLCDHVAGDVRKAAFLTAFDPVGVVDIWPDADPFAAEFNRAVRLTREGWTVWTDGEVIG